MRTEWVKTLVIYSLDVKECLLLVPLWVDKFELMNYLVYDCFLIKAGTLPSGVWFDWLTCGVFTHSAMLHCSWLPLGTHDSPYLWTVIGNYIISLPALNLLMKLPLLAFFHLGENQMNFFPSFLPNLIL